jgi:hypothetical protein
MIGTGEIISTPAMIGTGKIISTHAGLAPAKTYRQICVEFLWQTDFITNYVIFNCLVS